MVAKKAPAKEESESLRKDGDSINFSDFRVKRWQVLRFRKGRRMQDTRKKDDSWNKL